MSTHALVGPTNTGVDPVRRTGTTQGNESDVQNEYNEGNAMLQRSLEKNRSNEGGFTLIELLVVIVILGILAAIVVFAIGGLSSSSQKTACSADANTIQTAEDAFYASPSVADPNSPNQTYATMATLTDPANKLLKKASTLYTVGSVTATGYVLSPIGTKCTATITGP
jgi:general secretion pathway protein G